MFLSQVPAPDHEWVDGVTPIAFHMGSLPVHWYGIFVFLGFVAAIIAAIIKLAAWYKVSVDPLYWFVIIAIPCALLGARIWSCCLGDAPWENFWKFDKGGLAIEGGVVLTVLAACIYFPLVLKSPKYNKRDVTLGEQKPVIRRVSMWVYVDAIIPCILLGHFFGRWGNYFNQELFGPVVQAEWLQKFLHDCLPYMYVNVIGYCHPLFLYEGLLNLTFFFILYFGIECIPWRKCGDLGIIYFIWYSILRLCLEPLRASSYTFTNTYIMTSIWLALGIVMLLVNDFVLWRFRNIAIWLHAWYHIKFVFIKMYDKIYKKHIESSKNRAASAKNKDWEHIKELENKFNWINIKIKSDIENYNRAIATCHRTEEQMLYYRNK